MKLDDFISETLINITNGISIAKIKTNKGDGVCPIAPGRVNGISNLKMSYIEFDISVTVSTNDVHEVNGQVKAKSIIQVIGFNIGADLNASCVNYSENINRIKFSVPFLPESLR